MLRFGRFWIGTWIAWSTVGFVCVEASLAPFPGSLLRLSATGSPSDLCLDRDCLDGSRHRRNGRRLQRALWRADRPLPLSRCQPAGLRHDPDQAWPWRGSLHARAGRPTAADEVRRIRSAPKRREYGGDRRRDSAVGEGARHVERRIAGARRSTADWDGSSLQPKRPEGVAPPPVAVISYLFWKSHFASDPNVLGQGAGAESAQVHGDRRRRSAIHLA